MHQLTAHDASFLYSDTLHANANITYVQIYDPSTAQGGKVRFKSILAHIQSRLHRAPVFRQRLQRVPLELDYPYWIEDEHFDLEHHVRHIALPHPGDWRQFCIQASRIHARALDLNRPLWEIYVIEGLDSLAELPAGSFALLTEVHHAAVDVASRNEIIEVLHDFTGRPPKPAPPEPWFPEAPPSALSLMCAAASHSALSPLRWLAPLVAWLPATMAFANDVLRPEHGASTRFNSVVSPHRVFDTRRFKQAEFERISRLVPGACVMDAVLAVCAGGLRSYLQAHGELPAGDLSAWVSWGADVQRDDEAYGSRQPVPLRLQLGTALADPVQRLAWIQQQCASPEPLRRAQALWQFSELAAQVPAAGLALAAKVFGALPFQRAGPQPMVSCSLTELPAVPKSLYLSGAKMTYFSAILPISDGMGLAFAVTRYEDLLVISPTSCRELIPDPLAFTQCLRDSFQAYLALADVQADVQAEKATEPTQVTASTAGKRSPKSRSARKAATAPPAEPSGRRRSTTPPR